MGRNKVRGRNGIKIFVKALGAIRNLPPRVARQETKHTLNELRRRGSWVLFVEEGKPELLGGLDV